MSLQVWLPLNGSTINQGIGGRKMSGAPKSWGNSLYATFSGSTSNVIYNNSSDWNYTDQFSFSCFINPNYTGSAAQFVFTVGRADTGGYGYGLQIDSTSTAFIRFGSGSLTISNVPSNTWTHIALTVNGTSALVYRNGDLVGSIAVSDTSKPTYSDGNGLGIGCFHYNGGDIYAYYGSIRDFRIYDNVLSPKEIREISNGILVHLPLTNPLGQGRKNYFKNHTGITTANASTISTYDSSFNGYTVGSAVSTGSWGSGFNIPNNDMVVPYGSSYTVSMDVYVPSKHSLTIDFNNAVSSGSAWSGNDNDNNGTRWTKNITNIPANTWTHVSFGSTNSHASNTSHIGIKPGDYVGLITSGDSAAVSWKVKNIKVELGSTDSGYSDAADDIGINNYLGNTSGITPKGTITGTLLNDPESPRGTGSLKCELDTASGNGSNFIQVATGLGALGQFTVTGWVKPHSCGGYSTIVSNSRSLGSSGLWIGANAESHGLWAYRNLYLNYTNDPLLTIDTWYHFAFTFDAGKVQMFVNGTAVSSVTDWSAQGTTVDLSNLYIFNSYTGTTWDTHFVGNLSDIRVYSTVLSQTEITNLYNAPIQIANSGALMTQGEFVES